MRKVKELSLDRLVELIEDNIPDPRRPGGNIRHISGGIKKNQLNLYESVEEYFKWAKTEHIEKKHLKEYRYEEHEHGWHIYHIRRGDCKTGQSNK